MSAISAGRLVAHLATAHDVDVEVVDRTREPKSTSRPRVDAVESLNQNVVEYSSTILHSRTGPNAGTYCPLRGVTIQNLFVWGFFKFVW